MIVVVAMLQNQTECIAYGLERGLQSRLQGTFVTIVGCICRRGAVRCSPYIATFDKRLAEPIALFHDNVDEAHLGASIFFG